MSNIIAMNTLRVHSQTITLVDQVEDRLLNYLKEKDIRTGDSIPNELELAAALGVARSVLREALSRLKMMGMIETRTRRGMILTEPTILGGMKRVVDPRILGEEALFDILGFRIALEIGICSDIFRNITPEDISELEEIVKMGIVFENNEYAPVSEFTFHAKLYEITGFDIFLCIGLMGILSLIYTMMGGIEAVVWTDALQVVILLGGAILVVIMAACYIPDGFSGIIREATVDNKFDLGSLNFDMRQSTLWTVLIATFFTNLTTYGTDQTMVQRYMTTETEKQAQKSVLTNALLTIPATLLFFFVGTVLYVYYKHNPADLSLTITDGDAILPWYIYSQLPQGVTGLLISGIFAAAMSTLSSSMNSAATAYVVDIHSKIVKKEAKDNLHTAKIATFFLGIAGIAFAYMMATWEIKSLWDEFNKILGLVLGSLGGLFLLGMITRKANAAGALCGIIGSIFIQLIVIQQQSVHLLLYTTTGFASCFIIGYIASWIIPGKTKNIDHLTIYKIFSKK